MPTRRLVTKLIAHNPDYWGADSPYGKPLTETRLGLLIDQATKVTSSRPGGAARAGISGRPGTGPGSTPDRPDTSR